MTDNVMAVSFQRYAPQLRQSPHSHDTASVTLVLRGMLREQARGDDVVARPLSLVIKPSGVVHANQFGDEPVATCQIVLSPTIYDDEQCRRVVARWRWIDGGDAARAALQLATDLRAGVDTSDAISGVLGVLAALDAPNDDSPPPWLGRALEFIDDSLAHGQASIRVRDAAGAAGVHPVHLSRVFFKHLGCTVSTWIRRRRVQRACELMSRRPEGLSSIAHAAGFSDHSHMSRVFAGEAGIQPQTYRRLVRDL